MRALWRILFIVLSLGVMTAPVYAQEDIVNMRVTDAPVRDVLTSLAAVSQVNIVVDDVVTGKITVSLEGISFLDALDIVTKTKGLAYKNTGNAIIVSTPEKLAQGFNTVHIVKLKYAKAEDIKKILLPIISEKKLAVDEKTNSILYTGSPAEEENLQAALTALDVPRRQVSLEAEVVAVYKTADQNLGVEWSWDALPAYPEREAPGMTIGSDGKPTGVVTPGKVTRKDAKGVIQFGRNPEGYPYEFYYQAKINALVAEGNAKVLAKPKLMATDGRQAVIFIGDHVPVVTEKKENGQTTATTEYVDAGIKLVYTPRIHDDGMITALVHTEVSTPTLIAEVKNFRITTRQADTVVRMKTGETLIIGGLIGSEQSDSHSGIPVLQDIPLLGNLFQSNHTAQAETEVVIFLTARLVQ